MLRTFILIFAIAMTFGCASTKKAGTENTAAAETTTNTETPPAAEKTSADEMTSTAIGEWEFVISNLPDGDSKGTLTISNGDNGMKGVISSPAAGTAELKNFVLENNELKSSSFEAQGYNVEMSGKFEGDSFTGKISAAGYDFPMSATRKK